MSEAEQYPRLVAGRYRLERQLGAGGMGEVYRARDETLRRDVALKRLPAAVASQPEHRRQLLREARSAAQVNHQGVAALHDVVEDGDELYLVMELVEGTTLRELLRGKSLDPVDALRMMTEVAAALAAAHRRGVVHYDLKPANLMVAGDGRIKILDFGLARIAASRVDPEGATTSHLSTDLGGAGTPPYMAPEVLLGKRSDARADLFSLGVVFYQMLSGVNPFAASSRTVIADRILHLEPPSLLALNPGAPPQLEPVLRKLLAKDPSYRYATADDLLVDLRSIELDLTQPPRTMPPVTPGTRQRAWALAGALGIAVVAALALLASGLLDLGADPEVATAPVAVSVADLQQRNLLLAVLPSSDEAAGDEADVLTRGLATMLSTDLTRLTRTHTFQLAGPGQQAFVVLDPSAAASEVRTVADARRLLGASLVLSLRASRQDDRVLVGLALIDSATAVQLEAATVLGSPDAFLDLYDQVARRALRLLQLDVAAGEQTVLGPGRGADPAWGYFVSAEGYLAERQGQLAIEQLERALAVDPNFVAAHARLGEALVSRFDETGEDIWLEQALQECDEALRLDGNDPSGFACKGRALFAGRQYADAVPLLNEAFRLEPTRASLVQDLSDAHVELGDPARAEAVLLEAIRMRPHVAGLHDLFGAFCFFEGRTEDARAHFEEAVRLAPDRFSAFSNLGVALYFLERWPEARRAFERALELNDRYYVGYSNAGTLAFFEGDYEEAAAYYERALEADDTDATVWGNVGDAYAVLPERVAEAQAAWQRAADLATAALERDPDDASLQAKLGYYLASLGDAQAAEQHLARALTGDSVRASVLAKVAQARQRLGHSEEAIRLATAAVDAGYSRAELRVDPIFAPLRGRPEWETIVHPTPQTEGGPA